MKNVLIKHARIIGYLLISGVCGWAIAYYLVDKQELAVVIAPVINYIAYAVEKELKSEGVIKALKK